MTWSQKQCSKANKGSGQRGMKPCRDQSQSNHRCSFQNFEIMANKLAIYGACHRSGCLLRSDPYTTNCPLVSIRGRIGRRLCALWRGPDASACPQPRTETKSLAQPRTENSGRSNGSILFKGKRSQVRPTKKDVFSVRRRTTVCQEQV